MRFFITFLALVAYIVNASASTCPSYSTFAIGSFSDNTMYPSMSGEGVSILHFEDGEISRAARHDTSFVGKNPNYVAVDGDKILAINAINAPYGGLTTLKYLPHAPFITKSTIHFETEHPAHVAVFRPHGEPVVIVSNFVGGNTFAFMYDPFGKLYQTDVFTADPVPGVAYQSMHSAFKFRGGVILCDYTGDKIIRVDITKQGKFKLKQSIQVEHKCEPRHTITHEPTQTLFLMCEHTQVILAFRYSPETDMLTQVQRIKILKQGWSPVGIGSAIRISSDNRFLYAGVRLDPIEQGRIGVFGISQSTGLLTTVGDYSTQGMHPRDFYLAENVRVGDECRSYIVSGNALSNNLTFIRRDVETGKMTTTDFTYSIDTPTCVVQI